MLAVDFNAQEGERLPDTFSYQHELQNSNKNPICYKNPNYLSDIDLILTNCSKKFFKTNTIFTVLVFTNQIYLYVKQRLNNLGLRQ